MLSSSPKITRVQQFGARHYKVEGHEEPFPSVTTVLNVISKPALIPWAKNISLEKVRESLLERTGENVSITPSWVDDLVAEAKQRPDQMRDEAADFGTQAHIIIEALIKGQLPMITPEMQPVVDGFNQWHKQSALDIHLTETMVYSAKYGYAGAMDAVAYSGNRLVALDWKTSNGIYSEYALQVAAYAKALEEMTGEEVHEAWIVRLGKRAPEFEAKKVQDLDTAFVAFRAALYLWKSLRKELI